MSLVADVFNGWFTAGLKSGGNRRVGKEREKRTLMAPAVFRGRNISRLRRQLRSSSRTDLVALSCSRHCVTVRLQDAEKNCLKVRVKDLIGKAGEGAPALDFACRKQVPLDVIETIARYFFQHAGWVHWQNRLLEVHKHRRCVQVTLNSPSTGESRELVDDR